MYALKSWKYLIALPQKGYTGNTMIIQNAIKCKLCNEIIISQSRHDFNFCHCKAVAVDGGADYLRRTFTEGPDTYEEISVSEKDLRTELDQDTTDVVAKLLWRTAKGKLVFLNECSTAHLEAILKTQKQISKWIRAAIKYILTTREKAAGVVVATSSLEATLTEDLPSAIIYKRHKLPNSINDLVEFFALTPWGVEDITYDIFRFSKGLRKCSYIDSSAIIINRDFDLEVDLDEVCNRLSTILQLDPRDHIISHERLEC